MGFSFDYLFQGFAIALTWQNLFWALVGCFIGTLVGVLPGIGPVSGIAILLPLTTVLPATSAIIMMAAIYYGAMYGGSTTAIVVNIPGEASSVPTAMDGYEMAKQGKAGPALAICRHLLVCRGHAQCGRPDLVCPDAGRVCRGLRPAGVFRPDVHGAEPGDQPLRPRPAEGDHLHGPWAHGRPDRSGPPDRGRPAHLRDRDPECRRGFHQRDRGALRDQRGDDQRRAADHRHQRDGDQELDADLGRYQAVHGDNAPVHGGRFLPGAPPRMRPVGHDVCGLRSREAGLQASRAVRQGGDRGGCRPGRGEQRHLHRRVRAAFLLRTSHGALDGGAARGTDDVRPPARADALRHRTRISSGRSSPACTSAT